MPSPIRNAALRLLLMTAAPAFVATSTAIPAARGDIVIMKNGEIHRGKIEKDNTLVYIFDGMKRVVVRDTKILRVEPEGPRPYEKFQLDQPLIVHGGKFPEAVVYVESTEWDERGRRFFQYVGPRSTKPVKMEQAINELGPKLVKFRGIDGFWQGQALTDTVPRSVVIGLLGKLDRKNQEARLAAARFLIQAEWYPEARTELDGVARDFPEIREQVANASLSITQLEAQRRLDEVEIRRKALQFGGVERMLRGFPTQGVDAALLVKVRDQLRAIDTQHADDQKLADAVDASARKLPEAVREDWKKPILEILRALKEAPDAVRDRFEPWRAAEKEPGRGNDQRLALALSAYVAGPDAATADLDAARALWTARDLIATYLAAQSEVTRGEALDKLKSLEFVADPERSVGTRKVDPELIARLAERMPPPLRDVSGAIPPSKPKTLRVRDDPNEEPTEYAVVLPPEYNPLRSYPALLAPHAGGGPAQGIARWGEEAARRGYIVVAPEYNLAGKAKDYAFSPSEHAAFVLSLRDALRRFAIDPDRVFIGGVLGGGTLAWDFALSHPDLFAGVFDLSGFPFKYIPRYLPHHERLPLYFVAGDMAPLVDDAVYTRYVKPLIAKNYDVTYVNYYRRGLEDFPEETQPVFDWMDNRKREPLPKTFDVVAARDSDERYYGVVIREFAPGRTVAPEAVEAFGQNLKPAILKFRTSRLSNLIQIRQEGIRKFDLWISPAWIDFTKKMEIRDNGRTFYKRIPKLELEPVLDDLRIRGDRKRMYWMKVSIG